MTSRPPPKSTTRCSGHLRCPAHQVLGNNKPRRGGESYLTLHLGNSPEPRCGLLLFMTSIDLQLIHDALLAALREDVGSGDITSRAVIPADARARARYTSKQSLVVAGVPVAAQ